MKTKVKGSVIIGLINDRIDVLKASAPEQDGKSVIVLPEDFVKKVRSRIKTLTIFLEGIESETVYELTLNEVNEMVGQ